ncbi:hypothetical protein DXG01_002248 [Tephrocybe rancida]|nr:hypothetical protein DXG01_002248 [Tephrocybe rancida]
MVISNRTHAIQGMDPEAAKNKFFSAHHASNWVVLDKYKAFICNLIGNSGQETNNPSQPTKSREIIVISDDNSDTLSPSYVTMLKNPKKRVAVKSESNHPAKQIKPEVLVGVLRRDTPHIHEVFGHVWLTPRRVVSSTRFVVDTIRLVAGYTTPSGDNCSILPHALQD